MIHDWLSPAKLNLFLYITGQRDDGYHLLQTLFQFIDYNDTLTLYPRKDERINLLTPIDGVPNKDNLIVRAAFLLKRYCDQHRLLTLPRGADISIKKRIPIGGGLGGGSSNAATVLVALNQLWHCGLDNHQLARLGLTLGADIPIFVYGHTAFAEGIGEQLQIVNLPEKWYLVLHPYPEIHIPTSLIFHSPELKRNTQARCLNELLLAPYTNVFEPIVRKCFYEVEQLISWVLEYTPARLTGTGSCIFSEFETETAAHLILNKIPTKYRGFIARGVKISPLYQVHIKDLLF